MGVRIQRVATAIVAHEIEKLRRKPLTRKPHGISSLSVVRRYGLDDLGSYTYPDHPAVPMARQCVRNALQAAFKKGLLGKVIHVSDIDEGRYTAYVTDGEHGILYVDPTKQFTAHRTIVSEGFFQP